MTSKLRPNVLDFAAAVTAEPGRATPDGSTAGRPVRQRSVRRLVAVEDVLFAEMDDPALAQAFSDAEVDRLAAVFGLSPIEVAELYRPAALTPAAAGAPLRRRARSTRAR